MNDVSCLMWKESTGTYAVNIKRDGVQIHREGLTMEEAKDLIEREIDMHYNAGIEASE